MPATFGSRVVTDPAALARLLRSPQGPMWRRVVEDGAAIRLLARRNVGVSKLDLVPRKVFHRPGTLRDAVVSRVTNTPGGITCTVGVYGVPYAIHHHEGTDGHWIPKGGGPMPKGKFLVFHWPKAGGVVYMKRVWHPGNRPNPFLADAMRDGLGVRYGHPGYR